MSGSCVRVLVLGVAGIAMLIGTGCDDDKDALPWEPLDANRAEVATGSDGGTPGEVASPDAVSPVDGGASDGGAADTTPVGDLGPATTYALAILHTNDLHSHLQGHGPEADYTPATINDDATLGGFARLATAIGQARAAAAAKQQDVLLLDGGDFMMGTLFQLGGPSAAIELRAMDAVGYDAVAMGNHELDWTPRGLAAVLAAAVKGGVKFPVLASNLVFDATRPEDDDLEKLKDPGPLRRKLVKELPGGLKVGFFGLLGAQAQEFAPAARPLTFTPIAEAAKTMVQELRTVDKVDLVIALSHSGIGANGQGEDRALAAAVPGIDVIVSGHTHEKLERPVVEPTNKTIIVTAGSYGEFLGRLELSVEKRGNVVTNVTVADYNLLAIDDKIPGAPAVQAAVELAIGQLDAALASAGVSYRKPIAETPADLKITPFTESGLGNLVTDAFLAVTSQLQPSDPPAIAVEVNGQIRAPIQAGKTGAVWFADLFRVTPLGIGPDGQPGSPLVTYYLTGKDLRSGLEIAANAQALGDDVYTMHVSGMEADYDAKGLLFQKVKGLRLLTKDGPQGDRRERRSTVLQGRHDALPGGPLRPG